MAFPRRSRYEPELALRELSSSALEDEGQQGQFSSSSETEATRSGSMRAVTSTRMRQLIHAPRDRVYNALVDPSAVSRWKFPSGMTCQVHEFDSREGGTVRISLTYEARDRAGKTEGRTDTYRGRFVRLVPDELVVEADEFETNDPAFRGEMMVTISLSDAEGGTELVAKHDGVPDGVSPADNDAGWREALARLAALVESAG